LIRAVVFRAVLFVNWIVNRQLRGGAECVSSPLIMEAAHRMTHDVANAL
jgi:hypothetical protein